MNVVKKNIPNAVTCLNIIAGFSSIIIAFNGNEITGGIPAYYWAFIFIGIAAIADFADGFTARLIGAYSDLGKELDSLCDLVSFGVAPAVILFNCMATSGAPLWTCWITTVIPLFAAIRLAKFNIDERQASSFIGLPVPANAIFWIGYISLHYELTFINHWFSIGVILIISWLMVSSIPMYSLKFKTFAFRSNIVRYSLIVAAPVFIILNGTIGFLWTIIYYILTSLVFRKQ